MRNTLSLIEVSMIGTNIRKYYDISDSSWSREMDMSTEEYVTLETEIPEEWVFIILSVTFSEEEWICREFFFSHAERKGIGIEYEWSVTSIMTDRDDASSTISDILHETPPWFNPEFYIIFFEKTSDTRSELIAIWEESLEEINSYRTIILWIESWSEMEPVTSTTFDMRIVLVTSSISSSDIDDFCRDSVFFQHLDILEWLPEYRLSRLEIAPIYMEWVSENIKFCLIFSEYISWLFPVFSEYSESGWWACSKSRDSHEYLLFSISIYELDESLEFGNTIYRYSYIIFDTTFQESLIFGTICRDMFSGVPNRDSFFEFFIRWYIDTTVHLFSCFENRARSIDFHDCMDLRLESVSWEYFLETSDIFLEILRNYHTNTLDFRVKYRFYLLWNDVFCYFHGNWKVSSIWIERSHSGVFI